jgi:hypothetical protein
MPTLNMLRKAIWALSLCPIDAGGTPLPPLQVLQHARFASDRDRLAQVEQRATRRQRDGLGFAAPLNLACCASDSLG